MGEEHIWLTLRIGNHSKALFQCFRQISAEALPGAHTKDPDSQAGVFSYSSAIEHPPHTWDSRPGKDQLALKLGKSAQNRQH
jgi:hypothetical protein